MLWITYATFYLCRVNFSIAIPSIMDELGFSKTALGLVGSALFAMYAIGQFVNGQLGDKFGGRKLIAIGIFVSLTLNVLFGFSSVFLLMMILWGLNGFFQSMGWPSTVKMAANWFYKSRGKVGGALGSSYQIGNVFSWALAGFVIGILGWRWGFWIPAIVFLFSGIHWVMNGPKNAPEEEGLPSIEEEEGLGTKKSRTDHYLGFGFTSNKTLKNPHVWCVAIAFFFLDVVRYGFMLWVPTFLFEIQEATISVAAYKALAMPLVGCLGAFFAGWASDRYFKSKRAPIAAIMLYMLALFIWVYPQIPVGLWIPSLLCLMLIGVMTYGPHVVMVGIIPMTFGTRKASASVTGFIDGFGYIGAAFTGVGSAWLVDNFGWNAAFNFWLMGAFVSALLMTLLWNYKPKKEMYL